MKSRVNRAERKLVHRSLLRSNMFGHDECFITFAYFPTRDIDGNWHWLCRMCGEDYGYGYRYYVPERFVDAFDPINKARPG